MRRREDRRGELIVGSLRKGLKKEKRKKKGSSAKGKMKSEKRECVYM
jgi:hypothetical protein